MINSLTIVLHIIINIYARSLTIYLRYGYNYQCHAAITNIQVPFNCVIMHITYNIVPHVQRYQCISQLNPFYIAR